MIDEKGHLLHHDTVSAQLSPLLALQKARHIQGYPPVVHRHGAR